MLSVKQVALLITLIYLLPTSAFGNAYWTCIVGAECANQEQVLGIGSDSDQQVALQYADANAELQCNNLGSTVDSILSEDCEDEGELPPPPFP